MELAIKVIEIDIKRYADDDIDANEKKQYNAPCQIRFINNYGNAK
ncbi:hypothetical protein [Mucilaginibacter pankratovii]|nr:hypothetical protein [Mucilaginibacter pankratovii]